MGDGENGKDWGSEWEEGLCLMRGLDPNGKIDSDLSITFTLSGLIAS